MPDCQQIPAPAVLMLLVAGAVIGGSIVGAVLRSARNTERAPWRTGLTIVVVAGVLVGAALVKAGAVA